MKVSPWILLAGLLALAFTLATKLAATADNWSGRSKPENVIELLLGDGRRLFANESFTMADVYFHSGYYPSMFDQNAKEQREIIAASHGHKETEEEEKKEDFFGQPHDWIDAFGRNFRITRHTHLAAHQEREILPWLRLAADLDPQKIETYTVGAYFMREHLGRPNEAEAFLREGLRHNPGNSEILFELGRIYRENRHDLNRARNVWEYGVKSYLSLSPDLQKENKLVYEELVMNLARLEDEAGNYAAAIKWFEKGKVVSPAPDAIQKQIDDIEKKLAGAKPVAAPK